MRDEDSRSVMSPRASCNRAYYWIVTNKAKVGKGGMRHGKNVSAFPVDTPHPTGFQLLSLQSVEQGLAPNGLR